MTDQELRNALRAEIKEKREMISSIQKAELSLRIWHRIVQLPEYKQAKRILSYSALPTEVQTSGLNNEIQRSRGCVYLPVTDKNKEMKAVKCTERTPLHTGMFRIPEPESNETIEPEDIDLVIAPGVAFDRKGNRLGFGFGTYDKYLKQCRCPIIGVCYSLQLVDDIPAEEHDIPMHVIITDEEEIRP